MKKNGGTLHLIIGDSYFLTFPKVSLALEGITNLAEQWTEFIQRNSIDCSLYVGVHKGDVNILRSHVFGDDISVAASLAYQRSILSGSGKTTILLSSRIVEAAKGTGWEKAFTKVNNFEEETFMLINDPDPPSKVI